MKRTSRSKRLLRKDRGSALLVSLMVIVGLSLLGLGFVAISETETAIAKNEQAVLQTQAVAEAGAKLVVEWFQSPSWGLQAGGMPSNDPGKNPNIVKVKTVRKSGAESGVYKPSSSSLLFDKPYRTKFEDRLWADENTGDVVINFDTDPTALTNINNILLGPSAEDKRTGEITELRVFAPPMSSEPTLVAAGGNNPDGTPKKFWQMNGGQRYGVATIKATAAQFRDPNLTGAKKYEASNILATHSVRLVVGELPLPIPAGPIQGNANVSFGGNFQVHWGLETSTGDLQTSVRRVSLPWANAFDRPHFEHGYEPGTSIATVQITSGGTGYATPPAITIDDPPGAGGVKATAVATVTAGTITSITLTKRGSGYDMQSPPKVTISGGGGAGGSALAVVAAENWPTTLGQFDNVDYFHEILGKQFEDPWYGARSVGDNDMDGVTPNGINPQCYPYSYTADEASDTDPTWAFQWQGVNKYPWQKKILFPTINYDYWKKIAMQGRGYKGLYYFKYDGAGKFKKFNSGNAQLMSYWANSLSSGGNLGPGVFFFDTVNGKNPQKLTGAARSAELTPDEAWSTNDFGKDFLMEGFVYMNTNSFGTKGTGKAPSKVDANYPGEPFRDVGVYYWDKATDDYMECPDKTKPCRKGRGDGIFTCQDLNDNGRCDIVVMQAPSWVSNDPGKVAHNSPYPLPSGGTTYIVKTWKSKEQAQADYGNPCTIPAKTYDGTNATNTDCSEPHEPYLNLVFPDHAMDSNNKPVPLSVGWEAPGSQTYRAKNPGISCSKTSTVEECTSNGYDLDGAWVPLEVILWGVLYNEGFYNAEGNAAYYGSVLIQDNIIKGNGTADVWFDEKLIKGSWAPANMPRVIVFNEQTDETQQQ